MTETKLFEIRDDGTTIPALCVMVLAEDPEDNIPDAETHIILRGGFALDRRYWLLTNLNTMETNHDPFYWTKGRTMREAHQYIELNWKELKSGDVIDVEFFLGETTTKKTSERFHTYGEPA